MSDPFPGKLREYCLRDGDGNIYGEQRVWASSALRATEIVECFHPIKYGLHVSSVRTMAEETEETLRDA